jgi:hypothetical protein
VDVVAPVVFAPAALAARALERSPLCHGFFEFSLNKDDFIAACPMLFVLKRSRFAEMSRIKGSTAHRTSEEGAVLAGHHNIDRKQFRAVLINATTS